MEGCSRPTKSVLPTYPHHLKICLLPLPLLLLPPFCHPHDWAIISHIPHRNDCITSNASYLYIYSCVFFCTIVSRPCKRCVSVGKDDTCRDVEHKKRGRPKLVDRTVALDAVVWGPSGKEGGAPLAPKPHTVSSALTKTRVKGKYTKSANYKMPKKATLSAKYVPPLLFFLSTCHGLWCHSRSRMLTPTLVSLRTVLFFLGCPMVQPMLSPFTIPTLFPEMPR